MCYLLLLFPQFSAYDVQGISDLLAVHKCMFKIFCKPLSDSDLLGS